MFEGTESPEMHRAVSVLKLRQHNKRHLARIFECVHGETPSNVSYLCMYLNGKKEEPDFADVPLRWESSHVVNGKVDNDGKTCGH